MVVGLTKEHTCAPTHDQQEGSRAQCAAGVSTVCTRRECDVLMTIVIAPASPSRPGSRGIHRAAYAVGPGLRSCAALHTGGLVADTQALASHRTRASHFHTRL